MYVKNPKTGRFITVNGSVYKQLKSKGVNVSRLKRYSQKPATLNSSRRSSTRGWKRASPKRGKERSAMKKKCGAKCFLNPKTNGYPVCNKSCKYDCRGIQSAYNRARQFKRNEIADKAEKLKAQYC